MATLFVYGTLMTGEVLTALIDRVPASRPGVARWIGGVGRIEVWRIEGRRPRP
jgi:hypothetical protein